jgi:hypothetical protein
MEKMSLVGSSGGRWIYYECSSFFFTNIIGKHGLDGSIGNGMHSMEGKHWMNGSIGWTRRH